MRSFILIVCLFCIPLFTNGQSVRFLGSDVNLPGFNKLYPAFSGDGRSLAFMYDYSNDGGFITLYTYKDGIDWVKPTEITSLNPEKINLDGGFCLNYTGDQLFFTSRRSNSVGGYDIWYVNKGENGWSNPRNVGVPINTSGHEAFPSLSSDGNKLYFSRCNEVSNEGWKGCKIMVSQKKKGQRGGWEEPTELPPPVNMGNDAVPKILSDGISLVFASDRPGGKGGIDLYLSRFESGEWSNPENLDFVNTDGYDISYSMYYRSDQAITAATDRRGKKSLGYVRIPKEYQPKNVLGVSGTITFPDEETNGNLIVKDFTSNALVERVSLRRQSNSFEFVLPAGGIFEAYVESQNTKIAFFSDLIDTRNLSNSQKTSLDVDIENLNPGMQIPLKALLFNSDDYEYDPRSKNEVSRVQKIIRNNPDFDFEIQIFQDSIIVDSIPQPGLSEISYDTLLQWVKSEESITAEEATTQQLDSMLTVWNDSLSNTYQDTVYVDHFLSEMVESDSIQQEMVVEMYSNDRTLKLAEALSRQISGMNVTVIGKGDEGQPAGEWSKEQFELGYAVLIIR